MLNAINANLERGTGATTSRPAAVRPSGRPAIITTTTTVRTASATGRCEHSAAGHQLTLQLAGPDASRHIVFKETS